MAENIPQSIEVPVGLAIFGSRVTEMAPPDLPEGVSPDCQDVAFLPGTVKARPCLHKLYPQLANGVTVTYIKTFVQPNGNPLNLVLDSRGNLWREDVVNNPNNLMKIGNVTPGSYCTSVTANGREYMAFHNGVTGTDIPRQYDGTNLDRVSQDACGVNASFGSIPLLPSTLVLSSASGVNITSMNPINAFTVDGDITIYSNLEVITATPHGLTVGQTIQIVGGTYANYNFNATVVQAIVSATKFTLVFNRNDATVSTGGHFQLLTGSCIVNGIGYFRTNSPIDVQVGFQVQILGSFGTGTNITGISILQGLATFTTSQAHGLTPGAVIQYFGPSPQAVATITAIIRAGDISTVTTAAAHKLQPGVPVNISGAADTSFNIQGAVVLSVIDATHFTYENIESDASTTGGTVSAIWPLNPSTYFTIDSIPNDTQFTVPIAYPDSNWTGGSWIYFSDGTYYVTEVLGPQAFNVKIPNWCNTNLGINTNFSSVLATPFGQIAPGSRQMVTLFQTRNGLVVGPSPPSTIETNGGQYGYVVDVPIGPPDTISRILAFTGAGGSNFFYIPVPAQINGVIVSTSTVINDNVTTVVLLDFSDNTLFDGIGIDIPGNDLFESQVLSPCLGVAFYASRLAWWGLDNKLPNFVNMGFDGGYSPAAPGVPAGWNVITPGGNLISSPLVSGGDAWQIAGDGSVNNKGQIQQSAYADWEGTAIVQPNSFYTFKMWGSFAGLFGPGVVFAVLSSASTGYVSTAQIGVADIITKGDGFITSAFNNETPDSIPTDLILTVYALGMKIGESVTLDEMSLVNSITPLILPAQFSYVQNLETFDGDTGQLGPTDDTSPIQCAFEHRNSLNFLTATGLHETQDNANSEPDGWGIREVSLFCGAAGPRAMSMGENFAAWVSSPSVATGPGLGMYVYTGGSVYKVSQEIQPDFDNINKAAQASICVQNDPVARRIYVCIPINGATAPNVMYPLDYRELDVASDLVNRPPVHISFTGKMICSDLSRKWTIWNVAANCIGIIARPNGEVQCCIGGGNGQTPGVGVGFGNVYYFDDNFYTDDDYGQVNPYYITYFFINHEMEQALQVGLHRKLFKRYAAYISGIGKLQITPYANNLANPYPIPPMWTLNNTQLYDLGDGLNVDASRCAFKIASIPLSGFTDNTFNLQKLIITLMQHPISPIQFGAI